MLENRTNPLPEPQRVSPQDPMYQGPYGANLAYPISALADSLGCSGSSPSVICEKLLDLCKRCAIRFGIPSSATEAVAESLPELKNPEIQQAGSGKSSEPRWADLAAALPRLRPDELSLDTIMSVRVTSQKHMAQLCDAVQSLNQELDPKKFLTLPTSTLETLHDRKEFVMAMAQDWSEGIKGLALPVARASYRQLIIADQLGVQHTMLTPQEQQWLNSCALRVNTNIFPELYLEPQPSAQTLARLGMQWCRPEESARWEPQLPGTRYPNTSLFGLSSHALHGCIHPEHPAATRTLISKLATARQEFERGEISKTTLHKTQEKLLLDSVKKGRD